MRLITLLFIVGLLNTAGSCEEDVKCREEIVISTILRNLENIVYPNIDEFKGKEIKNIFLYSKVDEIDFTDISKYINIKSWNTAIPIDSDNNLDKECLIRNFSKNLIFFNTIEENQILRENSLVFSKPLFQDKKSLVTFMHTHLNGAATLYLIILKSENFEWLIEEKFQISTG